MENQFRIIVAAIDAANRKGTYSLADSHTIANCIIELKEHLGIKDPEPQEDEQPTE